MKKTITTILSAFILFSCKKKDEDDNNVIVVTPTSIDTGAILMGNQWRLMQMGEDKNKNGVLDASEAMTYPEFRVFTFHGNGLISDTVYYNDTPKYCVNGYWKYKSGAISPFEAAFDSSYVCFIYLKSITDTSLIMFDTTSTAGWMVYKKYKK